MKKYIYPATLSMLFIVLTATILPSDAIYGSYTDWLSQHAALAETLRDACVEQHTLLPDWINLGGGSNGYQFSYYGFLRPDIIIGCLFPSIPMVSILIGYMLCLYLASVLLCYAWLQSEDVTLFFAMIGSILFMTAGCLFHMHRQVMFVSYMPFLLLAFLCVRKKKFRFLPLCLLLICLHSFYFSIAAFAAVGWYWLRNEGDTIWKNLFWGNSFFKNYIPAVILSVCMAAALLFPTGLVLMEHNRKAGGFSPLKILKLFEPNISMNNLLFNEYGPGLTLICFYTLLAGLSRKNKVASKFRIDSILFLSFGLFGIFPYILNGTLYARPKILIPFMPLIVLHCVSYLKSAYTESSLVWYPLYPFAAMLPIGLLWSSQVQFPWILVELGLLFLFCIIQRKNCFRQSHNCQLSEHAESRVKKRRFSKYTKASAKNFQFPKCVETLVFLLLVIAPIGMYITTAEKEDWVKKEELDSGASSEQLAEIQMDQLYHFDSLTDPLTNGNKIVKTGMTRSSMYSSVTNSSYSELYYDTLMTPIRINNRIALLTSDNPFMLRLLGVRYIETEKNQIPCGYEPKFYTEAGTVIAENKNVLPRVYFTAAMISEEEFDRLDEMEKLKYISCRTVVGNSENNDRNSNVKNIKDFTQQSKNFDEIKNFSPELTIYDSDGNVPNSAVEKLPKGLDIQKTGSRYEITAEHKRSLTVSLSGTKPNSIVLLSFQMKNKTFSPVVIDINNIRNKLSGLFAPYPNGNDTFHYQLSTDDADGVTKLHITFSKGRYEISNLQWSLCDKSIFTKQKYTPAVQDTALAESSVSANAFSTENSRNAKHTDFARNKRRVTEEADKEFAGMNVFSGTLRAEQEGIIATSIPRQNGLELWIDGKQSDIITVNKAFIGAVIDKGLHQIEIRFSPPGKQIAYVISLTATLCYLCYIIVSILQERRHLF